MFMGPGMIEFFEDMKAECSRSKAWMKQHLRGMFSGIKGFVILDTCGDGDKLMRTLKRRGLKAEVLETRKIGTDNVLRVVTDAIDHA